MPKQYTFKTTRDTAWLEPILDELQHSKELSVTIRNALCIYFDNDRPAVRHGQTKRETKGRMVLQKVTQEVTPVAEVVPEVRPVVPSSSGAPKISAIEGADIEEDLEGKLDSILKMYD